MDAMKASAKNPPSWMRRLNAEIRLFIIISIRLRARILNAQVYAK